MSRKPTPQELDAERQKLLGAARAEKADPAKTGLGLDALLAGEVKPLDIEPPTLGGRKKPWWLVGVGVLLLALLWWLLGRPSPTTDVAPPLVPPLKLPAVITDAGALSTQTLDPGLIDAGALSTQTLDAGAVVDVGAPELDAGSTRIKPTPPVEEVDTLAAELKLLDEARSTLKSDPKLALAVLDRYARKFPRGSLELEASLVRVEALFALGRRAEGQKLVEKLRKRDSGGLLEERLRKLELAP